MTRTRSANGNNGAKWIRPEKRLAIYMRDGMECVFCQVAVVPTDNATLDHIRPRSRGGSNEARNLVTCCLPCNSARQGRPLRDFASPEALARVARVRRRVVPLELARAIRRGELALEIMWFNVGG